jgi:triacylglycerol lipase
VTPAGSIEERAAQLKAAINEAFPRGKVHILAHSMGGLDARYMIKMLGMGKRVRTLTTVSTPHHGSFYADFANKFIAQYQGMNLLAGRYKLNFSALKALSVYNIQNFFNPVVTDHPLVDYFSYAGSTSLRHLPLPYWGMKLVISTAEKAAVGKKVGRATRAALNKAIPQGSTNVLGLIRNGGASLDWLIPEEAGRSDGVVSVSSARWGTYLGEIPMHHLEQIGEGTHRHIKVWEDILRRLASMGY